MLGPLNSIDFLIFRTSNCLRKFSYRLSSLTVFVTMNEHTEHRDASVCQAKISWRKRNVNDFTKQPEYIGVVRVLSIPFFNNIFGTRMEQTRPN